MCDLLFSMNVGTLQVNCNVLASKLDADTAFQYAVKQMRPQVTEYLEQLKVSETRQSVFKVSILN